MAAPIINPRNIKFTLYEMLDAESLCGAEYYSDHNKKTFDLVIDAAINFSKKLLLPPFEEMDRRPPELADKTVKVHPSVKKIMKEAGKGNWISSVFPYDMDGEQIPWMIFGVCSHIMYAANYSGAVYPELTRGAANLIVSFGSPEQQKEYLPNMTAGKWQGTMALTEPDAGSSLADIKTTAFPAEGGYYRIKGEKVFISAGDHDGVENVVHLMLARIDGAPKGIKGISLFIVPKLRTGQNNTLESNDIEVSQVFHKLGYRGCPITQLSIGEKDDCKGFLVGEPGKGLAYMFQMMNEARLGVGLGALSIATAAYHAALDYAKTRHQGRTAGQKGQDSPLVPIIEHSDVKRMLLFQKSVCEGSLSLVLQCFKYLDLMKTDPSNKKKYTLLLDILTPVAKSYPSEMSNLSCSMAIQCFGGYGYCDDFPVEQLYRDTRIHTIHEGTTGIQGMDLLGRKISIHDGKAFKIYQKEVTQTIMKAKDFTALKTMADELSAALEDLRTVTTHLLGIAKEKGTDHFLADATLYLEYFSNVTLAWQWLEQAITAMTGLGKTPRKKETQFYNGKLNTCRYFFNYELPKNLGLAKRLRADDPVTVHMSAKEF